MNWERISKTDPLPRFLQITSVYGEGAFEKHSHRKHFPLTAAAANYEKRDDEDPDPVVVKNTAKTVVIHKISSLRYMCFDRERGSHYHNMSYEREGE